MNKLRDVLNKTPQWLRIFNRKYQLKTVARMNELLEEKGMTQKEVAEAAGWTEGYVSRILSGRQNLTLKTLARFEAAVGADVLEVAGEGNSKWPSHRRVVVVYQPTSVRQRSIQHTEVVHASSMSWESFLPSEESSSPEWIQCR